MPIAILTNKIKLNRFKKEKIHSIQCQDLRADSLYYFSLKPIPALMPHELYLLV